MHDPFKIVVFTTGVLGTVWGTTMAVSSNGIGGDWDSADWQCLALGHDSARVGDP